MGQRRFWRFGLAIPWARRHRPMAILIPTALATVTATTITNVPEILPFGQELGIGVMGVGYSYIAAYIFNLLVLELPKAAALKGFYGAARPALVRLAGTPSHMVQTLAVLADKTDRRTEVGTADELKTILRRISWSRHKAGGIDIMHIFTSLVERHSDATAGWCPSLLSLSPQLRHSSQT